MLFCMFACLQMKTLYGSVQWSVCLSACFFSTFEPIWIEFGRIFVASGTLLFYFYLRILPPCLVTGATNSNAPVTTSSILCSRFPISHISSTCLQAAGKKRIIQTSLVRYSFCFVLGYSYCVSLGWLKFCGSSNSFLAFSAESDDEIMRGVQTRSSVEIGKFKRGKTRYLC